jgi:outer membrane lipoprotein SlyB
MQRLFSFASLAITVAALAGCAPDYSPNIYAANAVQQANKVEPGVVVGYRQVGISAAGTVGAVTGGAVGGILGSGANGGPVVKALSTLGGTVVGGIVGTTIEHAASDTTGWEYIVRKPNGDLLSVTQREPTPIPIGQKVLVITGNQARVLPDYSVALDPPDQNKTAAKDAATAAADETRPASASVAPAAVTSSTPSPSTVAASHERPPAPASTPVAVAAAAPSTPSPTVAASHEQPPASAPVAPAVAASTPPPSTVAASPAPSIKPQDAAPAPAASGGDVVPTP